MTGGCSSRKCIFWLQMTYLAVLVGILLLWYIRPDHLGRIPLNWLWSKDPNYIGPIPIAVPWVGALGGVSISLFGVFSHRYDWEVEYKYWHWARPFVGAIFACMSVLIFQSGILAVGSQVARSSEPNANLLYYVISFLVAYREQTFRSLITRVTDVILTPGGEGQVPIVREMTPETGPISGGTEVLLSGSGLAGVSVVMFGNAYAKFRVSSGTELRAVSPPHSAEGTVPVLVISGSAVAWAGSYTYVR